MANDEKSSSHGGSPAWLAAMAALFGTMVYGVTRPADKHGTPETVVKASADDKAADPEEPDPFVVLRDLHQFRTEKSDKPTDVAWRVQSTLLGNYEVERVRPKSPSRLNLADALKEGYKDAEFEFLIVTVPDPIDSKYALEFDAVIEAVQRAYEVRGFVLQSSWLPWPRKTEKDASVKEPNYRKYPGSLLFRLHRQKEEDKLVFSLVCLVGENPISGIHKMAMTKALDMYDELANALELIDALAIKPNKRNIWHKSDKCFSPDVIRIVGPYYTVLV